MTWKHSFTPLVKIAFIVLLIGATLVMLEGTTSFLPVQLVPWSFLLMFGGAGTLSFFWKPKRLPQEREVMLYICAKCKKQLTTSEVYVSEGKNIPENHRCIECYRKEQKEKEGSK